MKKTLIKVIISTMTFISTLSFGSFAKAATADQLYANAYNATSTAISQKTQTSINNARTSINALQGTGASWAIGEFSKQVDQVQQPILVNIVNKILVVQNEDKQNIFHQLEINAAYDAIPSNLPDVWRSSYSSAVDTVEQDYQKKILAARDYFYKTGLSFDHNIMSDMVTDLAQTTNLDLQHWAIDITFGK